MSSLLVSTGVGNESRHISREHLAENGRTPLLSQAIMDEEENMSTDTLTYGSNKRGY